MTPPLSADEKQCIAANLIQECRDRVGDDMPLPMAEVEQAIREYCDAVLALPEEARSAHQEPLQTLFDGLSSLGEELKEAREHVQEHMLHLESLRRAHTAYAGSQGMATMAKKTGKYD